MVTLAEEGAPSAELAVDQAGDVRQEALQPPRQRPRRRSFTHEMDMVRLDRKVDDPKRPAPPGKRRVARYRMAAQALTDGLGDVPPSQTADVPADPHRHVRRVPSLVKGTAHVRHRRLRVGFLRTARAGAAAPQPSLGFGNESVAWGESALNMIWA
jgi:hypothetical protein